MLLMLIVVMATGAFALASSMLFEWASRRSPLWNIGFFLMLILTSAGALLLVVTVLSRRLAL
jgi:hypothetical protein